MQTNESQNNNNEFRSIGYIWAAIAATFWIGGGAAIIWTIEASK